MGQDNSRSDTKEEKISEPVDITKETIQIEARGGKKDERKTKKGLKESLRTNDTVSSNITCVYIEYQEVKSNRIREKNI